MKKQALLSLLVCLMFTLFSPRPLLAAISTAPATEMPAENPEATQLIRRLEELKAMDKTEMSSGEKKALRQEVRGIKKELRAVSGGVYLSIGAIIIIVLLLILLL